MPLDRLRIFRYRLAMLHDIRPTLRRLDNVTRLGVAVGFVAACTGIAVNSEWLGLSGFIVAATAVIIPNWTALELMGYNAAERDKPLPPITPEFWREVLPQAETPIDRPRAEISRDQLGPTIH